MIYPWFFPFLALSLGIVINNYFNVEINIFVGILILVLALFFRDLVRFLILNIAIFIIGLSISFKEQINKVENPVFVECLVVSFPEYAKFGKQFSCKVINSNRDLKGKTLNVLVEDKEGKEIYLLSKVAFIGILTDKGYLKPKKYFLKVDNKDNFLYSFFHFRDKLIENYSQNSIDKKTFSVGTALIFGERRFLDDKTLQPFYQTGLAHLIAISGSHIAIIFLSLSLIFFFLSKQFRYLLLIIILPFYAVFTGFTVPVVRAVFMSVIVLISKLINLKENSLNILFFTAFIFLFLNPESLFSISFQLSFLAVFGIIVSLKLFEEQSILIKTFVASIFATVYTLPIVIYYFGNFSPTTILATPVASLPLYPFLTLSILNIFTGFDIPFLVKIMDFFGLIFIKIVDIFNNFGLFFTGFETNIFMVILYFLILTALVLYPFRIDIKMASIFVLFMAFLLFSKSDTKPKIYVFQGKSYPSVIVSNRGKCYLFTDYESFKFLTTLNKVSCEKKYLLTENIERFTDDFLSHFDEVKTFKYQVIIENILYKKWINPILQIDNKTFELTNEDRIYLIH